MHALMDKGRGEGQQSMLQIDNNMVMPTFVALPQGVRCVLSGHETAETACPCPDNTANYDSPFAVLENSAFLEFTSLAGRSA